MARLHSEKLAKSRIFYVSFFSRGTRKNSSFHCEKSHRKYAGLYYSGGRRFYLPKFPLCKTYRATGRMAILIMEAAGFHNNIMQY